MSSGCRSFCPDIDVARASEADAAEILKVQKLAFHGQALLYNDLSLPPLVQTLDELIRDFEEHLFLKAVCRGKIIGSVRGAAKDGTCHISRLIVQPDHQNKGVGKMLMIAIEKTFAEVRRYELFTGHKSEKNLALYEKLGYREYSRKPQSEKVMLIMLEKKRDQGGEGKASFLTRSAQRAQRKV